MTSGDLTECAARATGGLALRNKSDFIPFLMGSLVICRKIWADIYYQTKFCKCNITQVELWRLIYYLNADIIITTAKSWRSSERRPLRVLRYGWFTFRASGLFFCKSTSVGSFDSH